jgi:hypothetical protein
MLIVILSLYEIIKNYCDPLFASVVVSANGFMHLDDGLSEPQAIGGCVGLLNSIFKKYFIKIR